MTTPKDSSRSVLAFGPFRWIPEQRALLKGATPVRLGSRARDILAALLERAGQLVKRHELIARVWPGVMVEEGTLRVHIAALRKALDCDRLNRQYVENVNGLGYRFVGHIEYLTEAATLDARLAQAMTPGTNITPTLTRMIGRDGIVTTVAQRLGDKRLLTVVGPGGIGKTTVANTAMEQLRANYADGARFVDFAGINAGQFAPATLAAALGIAASTRNPLHDTIDLLASRRMLIVFDNCEHVIDAIAPLAEALLQGTTDIHILATSREPLRAQGESVLRLPPLDVPPLSRSLSAVDALEYSAMQLFVEHAAASDHAFELTDAEAPMAAEICRRVDGLPLAIELAAAHVGLFGIRGLAAHLDDLLDLLTQGRRTAAPRQQTLRASLEWSFNLLSPTERAALRRLSTFDDSFDLAAARAVVSQEGIDKVDVVDVVSRLTAKSLIAVDSGTAGVFRLFQTTRSYALAEMRALQ